MEFAESEKIELTPEEARVLGCLLEKEATTPGSYPLTFPALLAACNQKTNRQPVVDYSEDAVAEAIEGLRSKKLLFRADAGSRAAKYRHGMDERWGLGKAGKALLAVLLLRGPQTPGELRARTERMHVFPDVAAAERALDDLAEETEPPLWEKLSPAPGQKEARYRHLLGGAADLPDPAPGAPEASSVAAAQARSEKIASLEARVRELETQLAALRESFDNFRREFE